MIQAATDGYFGVLEEHVFFQAMVSSIPTVKKIEILFSFYLVY